MSSPLEIRPSSASDTSSKPASLAAKMQKSELVVRFASSLAQTNAQTNIDLISYLP
jgi:hypothetical protein